MILFPYAAKPLEIRSFLFLIFGCHPFSLHCYYIMIPI
nr:MAG TPA: hypothetical protein [Caudoviricetes sp.]